MSAKAYHELYAILDEIGPVEALKRLQGVEPPGPKSDLFETISPARDNGRVLPDKWRNVPKLDRKTQRVLRNSNAMQRIGSWFNRKPTSLWTLAEGIALAEIRPDSEDIETLEAYYLAPLDRDQDFRRRDLLTLLNNWNGELDRARIWKAENP